MCIFICRHVLWRISSTVEQRVRFVALVDQPFHDPCGLLVSAVSSENDVDVLHTYNFIGKTLCFKEVSCGEGLHRSLSPKSPVLIVFFSTKPFCLAAQA